jgi:hypothetical protein
MTDINSIENYDLDAEFSSKEFPVQTGEQGYLQNYEVLEKLKSEAEDWKKILSFSGGIFALSLPAYLLSFAALAAPLSLIGAGTLVALEIWIRTSRLIPVIEMLLEEFGERGILITPRIKTSEGIIDIFVRTPDRRHFAFMLRSKGKSMVKWREDRQGFFISGLTRKGKKFTGKWEELTKLNKKLEKMTVALKEEHPSLMGATKTDRKKLIMKAMVLTGETKVDPKNDPALFVDFGLVDDNQTKPLRVKLDSVSYLLDSENIVNFLLLPKK